MSSVDDKLFQERIEAMNNIANRNLVGGVRQKSKTHLQGAIIGGIIGLVGAIALRKKPIYGIIIGSVLGRIIIKKIK